MTLQGVTGKNLCESVRSGGTAGQSTFRTGAVLPIAESSLRYTSSSAHGSADRELQLLLEETPTSRGKKWPLCLVFKDTKVLAAMEASNSPQLTAAERDAGPLLFAKGQRQSFLLPNPSLHFLHCSRSVFLGAFFL